MNPWQHFFKPEVRSSGRAFVTKGKVSVSQLSDTEIQGYVRASTSFKVVFKSPSVASKAVLVDCTCPPFKKGQFCKHIWAALLVIEDKFPDFLESKTEILKKEHDEESDQVQSAYKLKQASYRKEQYQKQYQKQKERLKEIKKSKKNIPENPEFSAPIEKALKFFLENGFPLRESLNEVAIGTAKKKLARVFHPDIGGSHDEILELNKHSDVLIKFSKSRS